MARKDECTEFVKYDFGEDEVLEMGRELARKTNEVSETQSRKKAVMTQLKETEERAAAEIATLSRRVSNGYEYRYVDCKILWHAPKAGLATIIRLDTGEEVKQRAMTTEEHQEMLPLKDAETTFSEIAEKVAEEVNAGALDTPTCKVTMTVGEAPTPNTEKMFAEVLDFCRAQGHAAVGEIAHYFTIAITQAVKFIDAMDAQGLLLPANGSEARKFKEQSV